jgi:hypothetical protein
VLKVKSALLVIQAPWVVQVQKVLLETLEPLGTLVLKVK